MAQAPNINVNLTLSYDTRGVASYAVMTSGKDQRRVNSHYEITRTAVDAQPDIALARRPGVTADGSTYGSTSQAIYCMGRDPASSWEPTPWAFVKDGSDNKVVTSATSVTILSASTYYPRFVSATDVSGTNYAIVQMQDGTTPDATPAQRVYYAATVNGWTEISAAGFIALSHRGKMEFLDGYAFIAESRNRIYQSDINTLSTWDTANYLTKSNTQDPPQGLMKLRDQILLAGTNTIEAYRNAGNATGSVLSRVGNTTHNIGLSAVAGGGTITGKTSYYVGIGDMIFFCGRYGGSTNDTSMIAYDGSRYEKISRPYEDTLLSSTTIYGIHKVTFGGKVAVAVQLTLPTATTQKWLMFFPDINEWFEWDSTIFGPCNNGMYYAGCTTTNKLYVFNPIDQWTDAGTAFTMTTQFRLPVPALEWKKMVHCGIIADTLSSSQNLAVSASDDDGQNWVSLGNIDLSTARKELYRCGTFRERFIRLTHTDSGEVRLRRFYASTI